MRRKFGSKNNAPRKHSTRLATNPRLRLVAAALLLMLALVPGGEAQAQTARLPGVSIASDAERVRVNGQGDVSEMRVAVVNEAGETIFESGAVAGQQIDWDMKDSQGERVAAGTYHVTATCRDAAGKLTKRVEQVKVAQDEVAVAKHEKASARNRAAALANAPVAGTISGSGTTGRIAKFINSQTIGNSIMTESGSRVAIGTGFGAAFALEQSNVSPNAGFIRFGDSTGWRLHFGRSREYSDGPINTGMTGVLMTLQDNGNLNVAGSMAVQSNVGIAGSLSVARGCNGCDPPSDRNLKANFSTVNPRTILDRLASIPIQTWNYKSEPESVRHLGPVAQDFRAAFNLGKDDKTLNTVDAQGVMMAAIQGLHQLSLEQQEQIKQQKREIDALKILLCQMSPRAELCKGEKEK